MSMQDEKEYTFVIVEKHFYEVPIYAESKEEAEEIIGYTEKVESCAQDLLDDKERLEETIAKALTYYILGEETTTYEMLEEALAYESDLEIFELFLDGESAGFVYGKSMAEVDDRIDQIFGRMLDFHQNYHLEEVE